MVVVLVVVPYVLSAFDFGFALAFAFILALAFHLCEKVGVQGVRDGRAEH